jgi:hypothetical protein
MEKPQTHCLEVAPARCYNCSIPQEKAPVRVRREVRAQVAGKGRRRLRMRATSTVVVLSTLLVAVSAAAGPNDKPGSTDKKKPPATSAPTTTTGPGGPAAAAPGSAAAPSPPGPPATSEDLAAVKPEDMPTSVRMRRLEQKTQALKERAWQLKARVQMLKEQMIGGGAGAQAMVAHANEMGASFRLIKLIYSLDGTQVFARTDDTAESLYKTRSFDVFAGPISPGNHNLAAIATYRGHGYGVFEYLSKYTFIAKGNQAFIAGEGKISKVDCRGFEKGGPTTPLEKRAAIECKVTAVAPEKPAEKPDAAAKPGTVTGPAPASPPAGAAPATPPQSSTPPAPPPPAQPNPSGK